MQILTRQQLIALILLTLVWGVNWPVLKIGVTNYPPLTFRMLCIWLGLPVLALALVFLKTPFRVPRSQWRELFWLALSNMLIWHGLIIVAVKSLSSGRAAILGYSMPIFSAVIGMFLFGNQLLPRAWAGVAAATVGVLLLLWHEFNNMAGSPISVFYALFAAMTWALGTHLLRRTQMTVPTLTISFWMTALTAVVMTVLSLLFERSEWKMPMPNTWGAVLYNAVLIFGFAHAVWFYLARTLPPVASSLSVMMIPILGVFSGAWWLGEILHWQDWAAVILMVIALGSVLLPARTQNR
ncbi:MAG: DMT family transporter [Burkholderiaceae bacterium]